MTLSEVAKLESVPPPPEERRRLASSFDSLVESNLRLTGSVETLVGVINRQMRYQSVAVGLLVVMFALAMLRLRQ